MENSLFHKLGHTLWVALVTLLVLLALYVSVGRLLTANLDEYRAAILQELNVRAPFNIEAQHISGEWHYLSPVVVFSGLRLSFPDSSVAPLELSEGRIGVDMRNSLRTGSLQLNHFTLTDLILNASLSSSGKLQLTGFAAGGDSEGSLARLRELLLNLEQVTLRNNLLNLTLPSGEVRGFDLDLLLSRNGSHRRLDAKLLSSRGMEISILAAGVGNPLAPKAFFGELYFNIQTDDVGALEAVLPDATLPFNADGAMALELWVAMDKGVAAVEARLDARDLVVAGKGSESQIPLDRLALQASFIESKNHWTVYASDLELQQGGVELFLPRMQLEGWGKALRIRLADIPLEPFGAFVTGLDAVPEKLRNVFKKLQPRGQLTALQLSLGDIDHLASDWEVVANFEDLAVESYKGAPQILGATGYAELAPGGGSVVLDSQEIVLGFPSIYHEPLFFDDLYGTLYIDWNAEDVSLSSGLISTQGEEGGAKVLFGLNIPLVESDVGIEMDLMVGLQNISTRYRDKYIPFTLSPSLLNWLDDSIGEGQIEQGAFLWRGSFRRDASTLRTVQLAFNMTDTPLNYHPQWPPVRVQEGVVLIDDSDVSVWADHGSLYDSAVNGISVETRLNDAGQMLLAVEGSVVGPAADGLRVLNDSALTDIVGKVFADWQVNGKLEADLDLLLNLTDKSDPPRVEVVTRWRDTDLTIIPGNLSVAGLSGGFSYSTERGFSSPGLAGTLWGKALNASIKQHHPANTGRYDPRASELNVVLEGEVAMTAVRDWLSLPLLEFASGQADVDVILRLVPGTTPVLTVESNLRGVALDLPQPWRTSAEQEQRFHLELGLTGEEYSLSLALGEELQLQLDMAAGRLRSGGLGVNTPPPPLAEGVFTIGGSAALLDVDQWLAFVTRYLVTGEPPEIPAPAAGVALGLEENVEAGPLEELPLQVVIDRLEATRMIAWGQQLEQVVVGLVSEATLWSGSLETDWLRGAFNLARDGGRSTVDISHLDISRLPELAPASVEDGDRAAIEIPAMDITLANLFQSERRLGALQFGLHSTNGILRLQNLTGKLAGLAMTAEHPGELIWRQGELPRTEFKAALSFDDLGEMLQYFGYEQILRTESGEFDVDLSWTGAPQDFSLAAGQGSMMVAIGPGSFLEAPAGAAGALKVVSILNLADIVRRLSLTHMFESGIPFDSVEGEVYLHGGTLEVARMGVQGPSSFHFSGVSEIAAQSLQGELVATLPVANNLPWVAALAVSPAVAAGVFIVSKVFNDQVNRLSSAVYTVAGSWNEPTVNFDRIFDDTNQSNEDSVVKKALDAAALEADQNVEKPEDQGVVELQGTGDDALQVEAAAAPQPVNSPLVGAAQSQEE